MFEERIEGAKLFFQNLRKINNQKGGVTKFNVIGFLLLILMTIGIAWLYQDQAIAIGCIGTFLSLWMLFFTGDGVMFIVRLIILVAISLAIGACAGGAALGLMGWDFQTWTIASTFVFSFIGYMISGIELIEAKII